MSQVCALKLAYTCTVKCFDGVVRTFEKEGYFVSTSAFFACLRSWDRRNGPAGEPYRYYVTGEQLSMSSGSCKVPAWTWIHHWPGVDNGEWIEGS